MTPDGKGEANLGQNYDPEARRDTPLALKLKARIQRDGPITVAEYMAACLTDPEHGYYVHRPAIGAAGDFITAPEISQVFGEVIGLSAAVVWQQMRCPAEFRVVELGPGRGTLIADALRASRIVPGFREAVRVVLVETSETLTRVQQLALAGAGVPVRWVAAAGDVRADLPTIVIGNEFIDALPVAQFELGVDGWCERCIGLDAGGRIIFAAPHPLPGGTLPWNAIYPGAKPGMIVERRRQFIADAFAGSERFAAVFLDYGHPQSLAGDTLQAVRNHHYEHPLTSPGEADLSTQVDFAAVAREAKSVGLSTDGPVTQAEFLGSLGIMERASRLMAKNPAKAGAIEMGVARLMSPNGMGSRFKAIGLRSPQLPPLPGFPVVDK